MICIWEVTRGGGWPLFWQAVRNYMFKWMYKTDYYVHSSLLSNMLLGALLVFPFIFTIKGRLI